MKLMLRIVFLALFALSVQAKDVTFNGTKPQAIIDVRTPAEFAAGHIDGAVNVPLETVGQGLGSISGLKKDSAILLYCHSGRRSAMAKTTLEQQGYTKVINGGGIAEVEKNLKACPARGC